MPESLKNQNKNIQILTFALADHVMAFNVYDLAAVTRLLDITPVPRSADFFEGMINLRGKLAPVISLRKLFQFPHKEPDRKTCLIAAKGQEHTICFMVDSVDKFILVENEKLEKTPDLFFDKYIKNVYKDGKRLISILNAQKLIDAKEIKNIIDKKADTNLLMPKDETGE